MKKISKKLIILIVGCFLFSMLLVGPSLGFLDNSSGILKMAVGESLINQSGDGEDGSTLIGSGSDSPSPDSDDSSTKTCPEGKFLNPQTNRCKNLQVITENSTGKTITTYDPETGEGTTIKICNDGYYLNEETNRCNKVKEENTSSSTSPSSSSSKSDSSSSTKTCPEGKFLNPQTNRCKNLQTVSESSTGKTVTTYDPATGESTTEKICNEGYELNPDTNRCNKKKENTSADYKLDVPDLGSEKQTNFVAIGTIILVILIGVGFAIFQFRKEITKFISKLFKRKE